MNRKKGSLLAYRLYLAAALDFPPCPVSHVISSLMIFLSVQFPLGLLLYFSDFWLINKYLYFYFYFIMCLLCFYLIFRISPSLHQLTMIFSPKDWKTIHPQILVHSCLSFLSKVQNLVFDLWSEQLWGPIVFCIPCTCMNYDSAFFVVVISSCSFTYASDLNWLADFAEN